MAPVVSSASEATMLPLKKLLLLLMCSTGEGVHFIGSGSFVISVALLVMDGPKVNIRLPDSAFPCAGGPGRPRSPRATCCLQFAGCRAGPCVHRRPCASYRHRHKSGHLH